MNHTAIIIVLELFTIIINTITAVIIHPLDGNDWNVFDANKRCK